MAWVLSRSTGELKEPELASAIEAAFGLRVTTAALAQTAEQSPTQDEHRSGCAPGRPLAVRTGYHFA